MQEVWKVWKENKIPKSHKFYALWEVSDQGNVKKNGVPYECGLHKGYKVFGGCTLCRAVAELFIPNPENKPCVDHINTNPLDDRACNLRWVTPKENSNNPLTLKHMSEAMKGKNHPMYGKPQSEESNKKRSESMKGKNTGPKSKEQRRKQSESMKRYWKNKKAQK